MAKPKPTATGEEDTGAQVPPIEKLEKLSVSTTEEEDTGSHIAPIVELELTPEQDRSVVDPSIKKRGKKMKKKKKKSAIQAQEQCISEDDARVLEEAQHLLDLGSTLVSDEAFKADDRYCDRGRDCNTASFSGGDSPLRVDIQCLLKAMDHFSEAEKLLLEKAVDEKLETCCAGMMLSVWLGYGMCFNMIGNAIVDCKANVKGYTAEAAFEKAIMFYERCGAVANVGRVSYKWALCLVAKHSHSEAEEFFMKAISVFINGNDDDAVFLISSLCYIADRLALEVNPPLEKMKHMLTLLLVQGGNVNTVKLPSSLVEHFRKTLLCVVSKVFKFCHQGHSVSKHLRKLYELSMRQKKLESVMEMRKLWLQVSDSDLPISVEGTVAVDPGLKGDTAQGGTKLATLDTVIP